MRRGAYLLVVSLIFNAYFVAYLLTNSSEDDLIIEAGVEGVNSCTKYDNHGGIHEWSGFYESLDDLIDRTDVVVLATVMDCGPDPEQLAGESQSVLFNFDLKQIIKGEAEIGKTSVVYVAGASRGEGHLPSDANLLSEGQEVVLFLKRFTGRSEIYAINGGTSTAVYSTEDNAYKFSQKTGIAGGIGSFTLADLE